MAWARAGGEGAVSGDRLPPGPAYVAANLELLHVLAQGYEEEDIALSTGAMLRECLRTEVLAQEVLHSLFRDVRLFDYIENPSFEVASDAWASFRSLLKTHKAMVAEFLTDNYEAFFENYHRLLTSSNYVVRRQSLKFLAELILERSNAQIAMRYISDTSNFMLVMNLLKDSSRTIQYEAFHVFKVFVANPQKPASIEEILVKNKERLLEYLTDFHSDKRDNEQFVEEKGLVIKAIERL